MAFSKGSSTMKKNSSLELLKLFKAQPNNNIVTVNDLSKSYEKPVTRQSISSSNINHYYTWNSTRTNASFHRERSEIITGLHSSPPVSRSNSFTKSHRVRDIVMMCSDADTSWALEDYISESRCQNEYIKSHNISRESSNNWLISGITSDSISLSNGQKAIRCVSCVAVNSVSNLSNIVDEVISLKHSSKTHPKWKKIFKKIFKKKKEINTV